LRTLRKFKLRHYRRAPSVAAPAAEVYRPRHAFPDSLRPYRHHHLASTLPALLRVRSDLEAYVRLEAVEACISRGWYEREPSMSETYYAFDDPSTGSGDDSWALAISHADRDNANRVTVDLLREWKPPFSA
jgi:hypothetical protein